MDKKNTMLLTVIAVATLLVAVVGATFAYFAISTNTDSSNTTITGSTEKVVTGAIALKGTSTLKLELSAEDMSKANEDTYYYAGESTRTQGAKSEGDKSSEHKVTVGTVSLGNTGTEGVTYKCTANYTIKMDKTGQAIVFNDDNDDAVLTLYDSDDTTSVVVNASGGFANAKDGIKLSELVSAGDTGLSGTVDFTLESSSAEVTKELQASLRI